MNSIQLQQIFFLQIKSLVPSNISMVDDVAGLLEISNDSAYRRIRGEKALSFEEMQRLSKHYHVSLDQIMNLESGSITFFGSPVEPEHFNYENYLKDMLLSMQAINSAKEKRLFYEAKDMPIFYYFQFTELAAFKYFFWMKSVLSYPEYAKMQFEDHELSKILQVTGLDIIRTYNQVPSIEIWGAESINATLSQLEYYKYAGVFRKKETIENLYDQLESLVMHIKDQAECGEKYLIIEEPKGNTTNYQLYFNELFLGHNSILSETDGLLTTFLNYSVLNYISTNDERFCNYIKKSFENTTKKSLLISTVSEKERSRFFNLLMNKIKNSKKESLF